MRIVFVLLLAVLGSCSFFKTDTTEETTSQVPVVRVYDAVLYESDVRHMLPYSYAQTDSSDLKDFYINKWVEKQLWLAKIDSLAPAKVLEIDRMVEKYREELYVYALQKQGFHTPLDTAVSLAEMQTYLDQYEESFLLSAPIIQAVLVKCELEADSLPEIEALVKAYDSTQQNQLNFVCNRNAESCHLNDSVWVPVQDLLEHTPFQALASGGAPIAAGEFYTTSDEVFVYFLKIVAILKAGEVAPLSFEQENIKEMILHDRKELQKKNVGQLLYREAKEQNEIEFY